MADTGSIRMATRWWSSSRAEIARRSAVVAVLLCGIALASSCTSRRSYTADGTLPRLDTDEARRELETALQSECPRLASRGGTGEARLLLDLASDNTVSRARISKSSGDERVDAAFGSTAARMHFERPASNSGAIRMGYSCTTDAVVVTIQVEP
jgi:TonB family protein